MTPPDREFTPAQSKRLLELSALAHERELRAALAALEESFRRWRSAEMDAFELSRAVHAFHQGPSRELFTRYDPRNAPLAVARALGTHVLTVDEVGPDLVGLLQPRIDLLGFAGRG